MIEYVRIIVSVESENNKVTLTRTEILIFSDFFLPPFPPTIIIRHVRTCVLLSAVINW